MNPPARYVDAAEMRRLLTPERALMAVQRFFRDHRREDVAVPDRIHLEVPGQDTVGLYMPAATPHYVGVKLAHLMPHRTPNVEAEVFLYDAATGRLLFWGDGKPLTALRTAAVSCAATLRLRPALHSLLVFGTGLQAAAHIRAFAAAYPMLERIAVCARSGESFQRLVSTLEGPLRDRVRPCDNRGHALRNTEAVITTTPAPSPVFDWPEIAPSAHVVAIGSATPHMNELPARAFPESDVWVDSPRALAESGDCLAAQRAGWRPEQVKGDLFDLLGSEAISIPAQSATLVKTTGHAAQDLALLVAIQEQIATPI